MGRDEFEARVGTLLRRKWKLERLIGVGGMAGVYVGRHKIGRSAAIKVLRPEIAIDPQLRERFEQEALAVNSIGHPGIVEILDIDEDDGTHFLVMELLEGETLADRVQREGRPKVSTLLDYVDQTLDVLVACHRKGVIHRDIKPENLFIQDSGRVKVLDFGIARMREGVQTMAGTMLGTVAFMPPEQLRGAAVDGRADLYALGATMFTVLTGRRVHPARDDTELAGRVLSQPAPSLGTVDESVAEHVCWVVDRALAYLPERRYPDAQTMRGDVWALRRGGRPPYANACRESGERPDVMHLESERQTRPEVSPALPSTDPQMPVFANQLPSTDPQMPAFANAEVELEPTAPEVPVIDPKPPSERHAARKAPGRTLLGLPRRPAPLAPVDREAEPESDSEPASGSIVEAGAEEGASEEPDDSPAEDLGDDAREESAEAEPSRSARSSSTAPRSSDESLERVEPGRARLVWAIAVVLFVAGATAGTWAAGLWP